MLFLVGMGLALVTAVMYLRVRSRGAFLETVDGRVGKSLLGLNVVLFSATLASFLAGLVQPLLPTAPGGIHVLHYVLVGLVFVSALFGVAWTLGRAYLGHIMRIDSDLHAPRRTEAYRSHRSP